MWEGGQTGTKVLDWLTWLRAREGMYCQRPGRWCSHGQHGGSSIRDVLGVGGVGWGHFQEESGQGSRATGKGRGSQQQLIHPTNISCEPTTCPEPGEAVTALLFWMTSRKVEVPSLGRPLGEEAHLKRLPLLPLPFGPGISRLLLPLPR